MQKILENKKFLIAVIIICFGIPLLGFVYIYSNLTPIHGDWIDEEYRQGGGGRPYLVSSFRLHLEETANKDFGGYYSFRSCAHELERLSLSL